MRVKGVILVIVAAITLSACSINKELTEKTVTVKKELSKSKEQQYYYIFLEANRKKLLGDLNGALALFYQCLEINPNAAAAMSEISKINELIQNYDTAVKYAKSAVENDSKNKWYKINLANLYIKIQNYADAITVYENLYENNKNDLEIPYKLAALYSHVGNYKKAIELYDEIEGRVGVNENISLAKQQLFYVIGNKTKAYDEVNKLIKHYPNEPRYYGILAEMYMDDDMFLKAQENYDKLFKLDSTNTLGLLSIIDFYRKKMDYDNAFKTIKKVINDDEIDFSKKVIIFVSLLNNKSEIDLYHEQIKQNLMLLRDKYPDKKDVYTLYADYLIKMNLLDEAKTEIHQIISRFGGSSLLWQQLLSIYSYNNDFNGLYEKSQVAIDSFPEQALFYLFHGVSASQIGKKDEAIKSLKEGLKQVKNNADLENDFYTNLAEAYNDKKEYKQSDYYFEQVLKKDPNNLYVINNYSYYLSLREEKLQYAESLSKKTVDAEPNNSTYLDTYAWILYKLRRYDDALKYIKRAFEHGGADNQVIVEHYGDIQYKSGNIEAAVELWKMSQKMGNSSEELDKKIKNKTID